MKKIITSLLIILISLSAFCQQMFISSDTAFERQCYDWNFSNVIFVDSAITKEVLFQKSRQWFAESFISAEAVIDNEDKAEGVIYGKGKIAMDKNGDGYVAFRIEIRCKNGKIKYIINDFTHKNACLLSAGGSCATGSWSKILDYGPLTQDEAPFNYAKSGRNKEKFWIYVKSKSKINAYNIVTSLKTKLNKTTIQEKDNW
jgi:hypothetical protein